MKPGSLNIWKFYLGAEGGLQNNQFRKTLISTWGCEVLNANYGMSEVCSIMASANAENLLRFSPKFLKNYYCELLVNGDILPLKDCQSSDIGELIVTSLRKQSQPVLRYNSKERIRIINIVGDSIYFEVVGRSDDMLVIKGINFFPEQLRGILLGIEGLTGAYKVEATKKNNIIDRLNLILKLSPLLVVQTLN